MSDESEQAIRRRAWPRGRQWMVSGLGIVTVVTAIAAIWLSDRLVAAQPATTAQAPAAAPATSGFHATAAQLKSFAIETVTLHDFVSEERTEGKIAVNGDRATPVYSPYSGRLTRVIAGLGDTVKAGAPLASIDASEFLQARNDLELATAQLKMARTNETRKHALFDAKGGSLQDWQQSQADLAAAETALDAARGRLRILGKSPSSIDALQATRGASPTVSLTAPLAGVVVDRQVGPGQYVQAAASTPLFTIADPSSVWLLANVREADAGAVHVGQRVEVRVPAYPGRLFSARLSFVSAVVDPTTHRLPVRATIDNRDGALKPEMFASFRILTSDPEQAPGIPESAVVYEGTATHVWVVTGESELSLRAVHVGRNEGGLLEVLEGLRAGERIVTKGSLFIDQAATPAGS